MASKSASAKSERWTTWNRHRPQSQSIQRLNLAVAVCAAVLLFFYSIDWLLPPPRGQQQQQQQQQQSGVVPATTPFRWHSITPARDIQYHDCYDGMQCARLDVPMDYNCDDPDESPDRVALAIIRLPAKVPVSDPRYGGAILVNPGGPGGSGVAKVLYHGSLIQQVVDSPRALNDSKTDDKYFDIIGFDPRGVNNSTPILACFPDNVARQTWNLQVEAEGLLGSSEGSLRTAWRRARAWSEGCSGRLESENGTNFLEHVNTTPVAADMVEIIERHGQWRERVGAEAQAAHDALHGRDAEQQMVERTKWHQGNEPLLYWGFSYGTLIGATFASMYPDRVSRVVLDGVVDAQDYYNGPWMGNLIDTDLILHKIMGYCSDAGPEQCPFWRPGGQPAIQAAYEKLLHDIWDDPLSVAGNQRRGPEIITWSDVKMVVKNALYQPIMLAPVMAKLLQDITNGTGALFAEYKQTTRNPSCRSARCELDGPFSHHCVSPDWSELEATSAVLCTDAEGIGSFTEDEFRSYWETLRDQSSAMGDYWAQTRLGCAGWKTRAKWRIAGPFGTADPETETLAQNPPEDKGIHDMAETLHPILWISNTLDTVTPLRNAQRMAARFPGSVLLQQDAEGHCSFTAPSLCTAKAIRRYFQTGVMPDNGTLCQPDIKPFELPRVGSTGAEAMSSLPRTALASMDRSWMSDEDRVLLLALVEIARTGDVAQMW
ncbi:hypothetical protein A1O1_04108 [Capronia coronata CBS 617.96]|uniref:Peptidase S33 tripeptidyl aminopeptidase-like C-terminal domain-containing protein n=1 Tax=Capronia coronata CBS 617.96 TaxID=1182541 RepID=W9YP46_9EURO|nr:uncharacterized protein A1O1_04108 [Capronia coronata CBS 617.96]EXJ91001.1 hypothetical protein A1O1_04108 [Capronia coronata CBS 617.96]